MLHRHHANSRAWNRLKERFLWFSSKTTMFCLPSTLSVDFLQVSEPAFCTGARNQKELCNTISMNNDIVMILWTQRLITVSRGPDEYYNSIGAYLPRWPTVVAPHAPQVELLIENNALPQDPGLTKIIGKKIIPSLTHSIRQSYQFSHRSRLGRCKPHFLIKTRRRDKNEKQKSPSRDNFLPGRPPGDLILGTDPTFLICYQIISDGRASFVHNIA